MKIFLEARQVEFCEQAESSRVTRWRGPSRLSCNTYGFSKEWRKAGILHREDGPAAVIKGLEGSEDLHYFLAGVKIPSLMHLTNYVKNKSKLKDVGIGDVLLLNSKCTIFAHSLLVVGKEGDLIKVSWGDASTKLTIHMAEIFYRKV